jgi:hypothetical protein
LSLLSVTAVGARDRAIHLRNETIVPPESTEARKAAVPNDDKPASGLFLIQFDGPIQSAWRDQLQALGVDLLSYIPQDAFIARLNSTPPGQIRQFAFVRWVGAYRPEHKVHRKLLLAPGEAAGPPVDVAILLSPRATEADAAQTKSAMDSVSQESNHRFGRVLRGKLNRSRIEDLARSETVLWIEPSPPMKMFDEVASKIVAGDGGTHTLLTQSLGYDGAGVKVAVADSGLDSGDTNSMHPDLAGRVSALFFYGSLVDASDEHGHGTHVAGIVAGNGAVGETDGNNFLYGLGVAPGSMIIGQRIFDAEGGFNAPPSFEKLTRDAKRAGADIASNSWGDDTQGRYDLSAMEFDGLVRDADLLALGDQQYIIEFSAGNAGPQAQTVGSPAVAKNVIATGAANSDRENLPLEDFPIYADGPDSMADFSSRGPCEDGRIKPDLVAPGSWIASLRSIYANDDFAWWPISDNYFYMGGTSQAGPHVSGAAAVFVQFYRATHAGATPSPALVKAALINSATDMIDFFGTDPVPNMDEGWGRVDVAGLVEGIGNYEFVDQTVLLTNAAIYEKRVLVGSSGEPFNVTLAYTDVPGVPAAVIALVNDLDLEVQAPDGHLYRGNQFGDGESIPDLPDPDTINNVEAVHLNAPVPGEYTIRVRARSVVDDARQDTGAIDQDFALVVSASHGTPGVGIVTFNRQVYRAPDLIRLELVDYNLAGQGSANITLRSGTDVVGETVVLHPMGPNGVFTGAVVTATGPGVAGDGILQVANTNVIQAIYADASPASNRVFTAMVDLQPPSISNVSAGSQFGQVVISWITDEPANSVVYYGTNSIDHGVTNRVMEFNHEIALVNLKPNSVQNFMVVSEDVAGNRTTNDNGGLYFTVTNIQPPDVLLVDTFADYLGLIAAPPLSGYTNALNAIGAAFDLFDARSGTIPTLTQLKAYRCVIWRVSDLEQPSTILAQRVKDYVNSGGSLFLASMEALSRFDEAGLASFNTDVLKVQSYTVDQVVESVQGSPGEPIGAGINATLDYTPYDDILAIAGTSDPSDWIVPNITNATSVMMSGSPTVGLRSPKTGVDQPGRVVFLSFPFDAVPLGSGIGNNRSGLLQNVLNFLAPATNTSTLTLDRDVYSVPGRAVVEVLDNDIQGQGSTTVTVQSPQHTNSILLNLTETARLGLFRGSFVFVATNTGAFRTLFVQSGDTVQATYNDLSAGSMVVATATIETNPPAITNVAIEPGYLEAIVTWDTSEAADSLVQYSESPVNFPINYTAYDPGFTTSHELLLNGLKANHTYYLQVVSHDRAGNTRIDNNGGQFYTFTTLQPLVPPWFDDIEIPNSEWSTFMSDGSETEWTRGAPGGGETAHSPTNCWGSNLNGGAPSASETLLVSPGILLTGGNHATLTFWHNYDFSQKPDEDIELATVEIITNILQPSTLLMQIPFGSSSEGWKPVSIDLTPYLGQVVYITWYYFLFAGDPPITRTGWLVDDVSITVTNIVPGTVQITNNIWQAVYSLSGPVGRTGFGTSMSVTGAPPGQYIIEFGDAAYYQTPANQTNTLTAGGTIVFQGNYSFVDVNNNGIPDGWELDKLGNVDPQRTANTDSDGDGMSDRAEFIAGTDPVNPPIPFRLGAQSLGNNLVRFSWPAISNHQYQVQGSANMFSWSDYSGWMTATGTNLTFTISTLTNGSPGFFRVATSVPSGPNAAAGTLRVTAVRQSDGSVQLQWPSALGHGYRVHSSTNLAMWTPLSNWIRASGASTSFTNPPSASPSQRFFRIEAAP